MSDFDSEKKDGQARPDYYQPNQNAGGTYYNPPQNEQDVYKRQEKSLRR